MIMLDETSVFTYANLKKDIKVSKTEIETNKTEIETNKIGVNARLTGNASKNLLDCSGLVEKTIYGITFTPYFDDNGLLEYIEINGTNNGIDTSNYRLIRTPISKYAGMVINGTATYHNRNSICINAMYFDDTSWRGGVYVENGDDYVIQNLYTTFGADIRVAKGYTADHEKIYPMIRYSDIEDNSYEPYYPTNVELLRKITELQAYIQEHIPVDATAVANITYIDEDNQEEA